MDADQFLQKFHNLEGVTVAERQKSFNKLMHDGKSLLEDPTTSKHIVSNLRAKTYLEDQFRVEILLVCRCVPELFEIINNANEVLIGKLVKHRWVFKEVFRDMTASEIINHLLPKLSYCIRIKVLKGLTLAFENDEKLSELFDCYKTKYGLPDALPILFGCSVDKIECVIKTDVIFLMKSQVKKLLRKSPPLLLVYVEEHMKNTGDCKYLLNDKVFIKWLASKYYHIFEVLKNNHKLTVQLGRRSTKKTFIKERDKILADPDKYVDSLKLDVLVRWLGRSGIFKQYFRSAFPKSIEDFSYDYHQIKPLLAQYPKKRRYQLLKDTFEEVYNTRFITCTSKIDQSVLKLMSCGDYAEERSEVAALKLSETKDIEYAAYMRAEKSLPYLKRKMNLSKRKRRKEKLIWLLAKTCKVNNDMASLLKVVKYVTARHKNSYIVVDVLLTYIVSKFDVYEFNKGLWDAIVKLINTCYMHSPRRYPCGTLLLHYAEFKYNVGESIKKSICKFSFHDREGLKLFRHNCKNEKFLQQAVKEFIVLFLENSHIPDREYPSFFENIVHWNRKHPDYVISYLDYPGVLDIIRKLPISEGYYVCMTDLMLLKDTNAFVEEMSELFWKTRAYMATRKQIEYFFRWHPLLLLKHNNSFFTAQLHTLQSIEYILRWMKLYDHLEFPQEAVKFCQDKITSENKVKHTVRLECLFAILVRFMRPENFANYIAEYKLTDLTIEIWREKRIVDYPVKIIIAKSFKYTEHATEMFPLLMSYCGGNYLKHVLDSLYKYFHRSPSNTLQPYLDQLASGAVSVRKHALFLTCRISDLESREKILKHFISTEKNMSLQKRLMFIALFSFLKYQSSEFWEIFTTSLTLIQDDDKMSFQKFVYPQMFKRKSHLTSYYEQRFQKFIPKSYFTLYYQLIWNLIEKKILSSPDKGSLHRFLSQQIKSHIGDFPAEFCYTIIDVLLLNLSGYYESSDINILVYNFLLHHEDPDRFSKIIQILQYSSTSHADNFRLELKMKIEISHFINRFCNFYHFCDENEKWDKKLLQDFVDQLLNLYPPLEIFSDYVLLSFTSKLIASGDLKDYTQKALLLFEDMVKKFGTLSLDHLINAISLTLQYFYRGDESKNALVEFIHELLHLKSTKTTQMLCFFILINNDETDKPGYKECLKSFEESNIPSIKTYFEELKE